MQRECELNPPSVIFVNENENENAKTANLVTERKCYSIQYSAYGCYGRTALNPWLTVDGI